MVDVYNIALDELITSAEDAVTDFKSWKVVRNPHNNDEPNRRTIVKALAGFANRDGGNLVIGVSDTTREPEGKPLNEERITGIISEIAADKCDPNVQWDYSFYTSDNNDLEDGDVYVVHIDRRRGTPHAITHRKGKREYRIRSGDETRLLTTDELDWLFRNQDIPNYYQNLDSVFVYHPDFKHITIELPTNQGWLYNFIGLLTDEDKTYLTREIDNMMNFATALSPFAFISSLGVYHINSWRIKSQKNRQDRLPFSSGTLRQMPTVDPDMNVPMEVIGEIGIDGVKTSILDELSLDEDDLIPIDDFKVPPEVDIDILVGDAVDSSDYHGQSIMTISKQDKFEFVIEFGRQVRGGTSENSTINWHPISNMIKIGETNELIKKINDIEFSIRFFTDFKFPDHIDDEYNMHAKYAENIVEVLNSDWNLDMFMDEMPDHIQYEINYKLDMLVDAFRLKN